MTRSLRRLLYKGKPFVGNNEVADKVPDVCFCHFEGIGKPLVNTGCAVHTHSKYPCDMCGCDDYRPRRNKLAPADWPLCVCGHLSQDHNP